MVSGVASALRAAELAAEVENCGHFGFRNVAVFFPFLLEEFLRLEVIPYRQTGNFAPCTRISGRADQEMRLHVRPLGLLESRKRVTAKLLRWIGENFHFFRGIVTDALYGFPGLSLRDEDSVFKVEGWLAFDVFRMPRHVRFSCRLPDQGRSGQAGRSGNIQSEENILR
jgi:hypothetical protein